MLLASIEFKNDREVFEAFPDSLRDRSERTQSLTGQESLKWTGFRVHGGRLAWVNA